MRIKFIKTMALKCHFPFSIFFTSLQHFLLPSSNFLLSFSICLLCFSNFLLLFSIFLLPFSILFTFLHHSLPPFTIFLLPFTGFLLSFTIFLLPFRLLLTSLHHFFIFFHHCFASLQTSFYFPSDYFVLPFTVFYFPSDFFLLLFTIFLIPFTICPSKHSSWWRLPEDVFKTSLVFVFRRRLEDVLKTPWSRRICSPYLALRLQKTSWSRPIYSSWPYVFKASCKNVFKTSSRRLQDVLKTSSRYLQDVFKTYYQVKVFLVTQFQDIFETYSKRFWDVLLRRLSTGGLPRSHFREIYGHWAKFPRVIKISQVLIFYFTTPFSDYTLQRRI